MAFATILVVDDTAEILELTSSILEDAGYSVLRCEGSRTALPILSDGCAIDLLLTDIMMPDGLNGFELAREARVMRPLLPVAYVTGNGRIPPYGATVVFGPILRKPFRPNQLVRYVEPLLAPIADARLVRSVALEMMQHDADAYERAKEAEEIDRGKGDELSADAWHDIAEAIQLLQQTTIRTT